MVMCIGLFACGSVILLVMGVGHTLPAEEEIIFSAHHGYSIYRLALARNLVAPVLSTKNSLSQPSWSADGQHIAFVNNSTAQLTLYIADADGRNKQLLTSRPDTSDYDPQWSPDGRFIAYSTSSHDSANNWVINVMLMDTQTQIRQVLTSTNIFREHMLSWSPDGSQIALVLYSADRRNSDLFSLNVQSGAIHNLASTEGNDEYPVWSPDGRYIVFVGGSSPRGLYVLDTTTGQPSMIYSQSGVIYPSDWSQDSRFIFFTVVNNIYKLEVASCLKNPSTCTPELLIKGGEDARRKPRTP